MRRTRPVHIHASSPSASVTATDAGAAAWPPGAGRADATAASARPLGNGSSRAAPKITTITAISARFATDTVKID